MSKLLCSLLREVFLVDLLDWMTWCVCVCVCDPQKIWKIRAPIRIKRYLAGKCVYFNTIFKWITYNFRWQTHQTFIYGNTHCLLFICQKHFDDFTLRSSSFCRFLLNGKVTVNYFIWRWNISNILWSVQLLSILLHLNSITWTGEPTPTHHKKYSFSKLKWNVRANNAREGEGETSTKRERTDRVQMRVTNCTIWHDNEISLTHHILQHLMWFDFPPHFFASNWYIYTLWISVHCSVDVCGFSFRHRPWVFSLSLSTRLLVLLLLRWWSFFHVSLVVSLVHSLYGQCVLVIFYVFPLSLSLYHCSLFTFTVEMLCFLNVLESANNANYG